MGNGLTNQLSKIQDPEACNESIAKSLEYLAERRENLDELIKKDISTFKLKSFEEFNNFTTMVAGLPDQVVKWDALVDKKAPETLSKILETIYDRIDKIVITDFLIDDLMNKLMENPFDAVSFIQPIVLYNTIATINKFVTNCVKFCLKFSESKGLTVMISMLEKPQFLDRSAKNLTLEKAVELMVLNLNWLSKYSEDYLKHWTSVDTVNILLNFAKIHPERAVVAKSTIINIANDQQLESISEIHSNLEAYVQSINEHAKLLLEHKLPSINVEIIEDGKVEQHAVHYTKPDGPMSTYTTLISILQGLYKISVNDKMRLKLYYILKVKQPLVIIIHKGNDIEKVYSFRLLAQLCFNSKISQDLQADQELRAQVQAILSNKSMYPSSLIKIVEQILWEFDSKKQTPTSSSAVQPAKGEEPTPTPTRGAAEPEHNHIMISYNTGSRNLCLQIKQELEKRGYKVWIDVNELHGSSLEAMANAVENSFCVLICITEKYRQSVNCQAEAQYAFRLNKPIIPLIMQEGYENVKGWLGIIIGDKIFVNFTKYPYEECIRRLSNELEAKAKSKPPVEPKKPAQPAVKEAAFKPIKPKSPPQNQSARRSPHTETLDMEVSSFTPPFKNPTQTVLGRPVAVKALPASTTSASTKPRDWTTEQVKKWFEDNQVNPAIMNYLNPCNGQTLEQLYKMKCEVPEFFYQGIKTEAKVDMTSIAVFTLNLVKLFESQKDQ